MNYPDSERWVIITLENINPLGTFDILKVLEFHNVFQNSSSKNHNYYPCDLTKLFVIVKPRNLAQRELLFEIFDNIIFNQVFRVGCKILDRFDSFNFQEFNCYFPDTMNESENRNQSNFHGCEKRQTLESNLCLPQSIFHFHNGDFYVKKKQKINPVGSLTSLSSRANPTHNKSDDIQRSKVLIISNLGEFEKAKEIGRFFRCFRGLQKVLLMKNRKKGFLEFTDHIAARQCCEGVNKFERDLKLRAGYSKYTELSMSEDNLGENSRIHNRWYRLSHEKVRIFDNVYVHNEISICVQSFLILNRPDLNSPNLFECLIQLIVRVRKQLNKNRVSGNGVQIMYLQIIDPCKYSVVLKFQGYWDATHFVSKFNWESSTDIRYTSRFVSFTDE